MTESKRTDYIGKVGDFLKEAKPRHVPKVREQAGVSEIIDAFVQSDHSRIIYVVDDQERPKGIISLGNLVKHFFFTTTIRISIVDTLSVWQFRKPQRILCMKMHLLRGLPMTWRMCSSG